MDSEKEFDQFAQQVEELKANVHLLQSIVDDLPLYIYAKDVNSIHLFSNRQDIRLKGKSRLEEVIGKRDFDFFPPEIATEFFVSEQTLFTSGRPILNREELVYDNNTNSMRWLLTSKFPLKNSSDQVIGLIGVGIDITDKRDVTRLVDRESDLLYSLLNGPYSQFFLAPLSAKRMSAGEVSPSLLDAVDQYGEVLYQIVSTAVTFADADSGVIYLIDYDDDKPKIVQVVSHPQDFNYLTPRMDEHSVTKKIIQSAEIVQFSDLKDHPEAHPGLSSLEIQSMIAFPLQFHDVVRGVIYLHKVNPYTYTQLKVDLLKLLVSQGSNALRYAIMARQTQKRIVAINGLYEAAKSITKRGDLGATLNEIVSQALQTVGLRPDPFKCFSYLALLQQNSLEFVASSSFEILRMLQNDVGVIDINSDRPGITGIAARDNNILYIPNAKINTDYISLRDTINSQLSVPLSIESSVIGVITIEHWENDPFLAEDIRTIELLATEAAIAIENSRHLHRARQEATRSSSLQRITLKVTELLSDFSMIVGSDEPIATFWRILGHITPTLSHCVDSEMTFVLASDQNSTSIFQTRLFFPDGLKHNGESVAVISSPWERLLHTANGLYVTTMEDFERRFDVLLPFHDWSPIGFDTRQTELVIMPVGSSRDNTRILIIFVNLDKISNNFGEIDTPLAFIEQTEVFGLIALQIREAYNTALKIESQVKYERERQQFVQDVTHQLIGPLSGLKAHAENLIENIVPEHRYKLVLETMIEQADMFQRYARNFSLLAQEGSIFEGTNLSFKETRPKDLIKTLIKLSKSFQGQTRAYHIKGPQVIEETFRSFPTLQINSTLFQILILNLLDNAVKYSTRYKNAPITIKGRILDNFSMISVTNHGLPLLKTDLDMIFARYTRSDAAIEFSPIGTGIGLYLCRQIMNVHQGEINAHASKPSKEVEGSHEVTFKILFPRDPLIDGSPNTKSVTK